MRQRETKLKKSKEEKGRKRGFIQCFNRKPKYVLINAIWCGQIRSTWSKCLLKVFPFLLENVPIWRLSKMPRCGGISLTSVQIASHSVEGGLVLVCRVSCHGVRTSRWSLPHFDAVLAASRPSKPACSDHKYGALVDEQQLALLIPRLDLDEQHHPSALVQHVLHLVCVGQRNQRNQNRKKGGKKKKKKRGLRSMPQRETKILVQHVLHLVRV